MTNRVHSAVVAEFLQNALAGDALGVAELAARARTAGLLGEGQRITHAKVFKKAKKSLGIRSVRKGFGDAMALAVGKAACFARLEARTYRGHLCGSS
jgi:hypothetical protein